MLNIEKGISIPKAYNETGEFLFILRQMKVNDSFLIKDKTKHNKAKTAASNYKKREGKGKNFTSRKMADGLRIWRIK